MRFITEAILILSLSCNVFATECYFISGLTKDNPDKPAFVKTLEQMQQIEKAYHLNCYWAESWEEVSRKVDLNKKEPLLILQAAHGTPGGGAQCDAGTANGRYILNNLKNFASQRQVSAIIESCYSGDLLQKKLLDDAENSSHPSIPNLCLLTSSNFNKIAYTNNLGAFDTLFAMSKQNKSMQMERIALEMRGGLISSAAWNSSGITDYLVDKKIKEGSSLLNKIAKHSYTCKLATPALSMQIILDQKLLANKAEKKAAFDYLRFYHIFSDWSKDADECMKHMASHPWGILKSSLDLASRKCEKEFSQNYQKNLSTRSPIYKTDDFIFYLDQIQSQMGKTCRHWINHSCVNNKFKEYVQAKQVLSKKLNTQNLTPEILSQKIFSSQTSLTNTSSSLSAQNTSHEQEYLDQVLGQVKGEFDDFDGMSQTPSPSSLLEGFVKGSIQAPSLPDPIDQKRRSACRNFKLK